MILIVDDEKVIAESIYQSLKDRDSSLSLVKITDSDSVINIVENNEISLIVIDILMPKKNGVELVQEIRKISNCPIVVTSSVASVFHNELSVFERIEIIEKPFDFEHLGDLLLRMTDQSKLKKALN